MGYRIVYPSGSPKRGRRKLFGYLPVYFLMVASVIAIWEHRSAVFGGYRYCIGLLDRMAVQLRQGDTIAEVVTVFWQELQAYASVP